MLRPFSDSRQLLRFIHPNISYYVSTPLTTRFFQSASAFKAMAVCRYEGSYDGLVGLGLQPCHTLLRSNNHAFLLFC
jgi:hypothetical protein